MTATGRNPREQDVAIAGLQVTAKETREEALRRKKHLRASRFSAIFRP